MGISVLHPQLKPMSRICQPMYSIYIENLVLKYCCYTISVGICLWTSLSVQKWLPWLQRHLILSPPTFALILHHWMDSFIDYHIKLQGVELTVRSYRTVCSVEDQNFYTDGIATGSQTSVSVHDTFVHQWHSVFLF